MLDINTVLLGLILVIMLILLLGRDEDERGKTRGNKKKRRDSQESEEHSTLTTAQLIQIIRQKIVELYGENIQSSIQLLAVFNHEVEKESNNRRYKSRFIANLRSAIESNNDNLFKRFCDNMDPTEFLQDSCTQEFKNMDKKLAQLSETSDRQVVKFVDKYNAIPLLEGVMMIWDCLPRNKKGELANSIKTLARHVGNGTAMAVFSKAASGAIVLVALDAVYLVYECFQAMKRWWKGEITGMRCAKICIEALTAFAGGAGGALIGAAAGNAVLPGIGAVVGAVAGGVIGLIIGDSLNDLITSQIFDLPKSEALENAYNFLGLHHKASNGEINQTFRRLCLRYHPDKGGDADKFNLLQFHMAAIKLERGDI